METLTSRGGFHVTLQSIFLSLLPLSIVSCEDALSDADWRTGRGAGEGGTLGLFCY